MTLQLDQQLAQMPLFDVAAGNGAYVYIVAVDGSIWSVRRWSDGHELFTREGRNASKVEAEARGYIVRK